jgi:2'-5' RNA ligase
MRTFIELVLPDTAREIIRQRQDAVRGVLSEHGQDKEFRWTHLASVHLTLRFLGETAESQVACLDTGLGKIVENGSPPDLGVGQLGGFPSLGRPRVLWLGVTGDLERLEKLQAAIEQLAVTCEFEPEDRPFSPHLTIARVRKKADPSAMKVAGAVLTRGAPALRWAQESGGFAAGAVAHMKSDLKPSGSVYSTLSSHRFVG